jgi:hypothetical protein
MVPLEPPMWSGRVLFTVRLGNTVRAPRLHTVVEGTPDSGYRQWPWARLRRGYEPAGGGKVSLAIGSQPLRAR